MSRPPRSVFLSASEQRAAGGASPSSSARSSAPSEVLAAAPSLSAALSTWTTAQRTHHPKPYNPHRRKQTTEKRGEGEKAKIAAPRRRSSMVATEERRQSITSRIIQEHRGEERAREGKEQEQERGHDSLSTSTTRNEPRALSLNCEPDEYDDYDYTGETVVTTVAERQHIAEEHKKTRFHRQPYAVVRSADAGGGDSDAIALSMRPTTSYSPAQPPRKSSGGTSDPSPYVPSLFASLQSGLELQASRIDNSGGMMSGARRSARRSTENRETDADLLVADDAPPADLSSPAHSPRMERRSQTIVSAPQPPTAFPDCVHDMCPRLGGEETGDPRPGELIFDAAFESGNLGAVLRVSEIEYLLHIRPDPESPRHRLWYYFTVSNASAQQHVLFTVANLSKTKSMLREGMAPVVRSRRRPHWRRMPGDQVFYVPSSRSPKTYELTFAFLFDDPTDTYEFAYCYPYTVTDCALLMGALRSRFPSLVRRRTLCRTVQGRPLELLTITSPANHRLIENSLRGGNGGAFGARGSTPMPLPCLFVSARVHPGESPASYICEGFLRFACSAIPAAKTLREECVVFVVPMLNPDGVYNGTYRGNSCGFDLNRSWRTPTLTRHPTVTAVKTFLTKLKRRAEVVAAIDLHAHSTGTSSFIYGNEKADMANMQAQWELPRVLASLTDRFSLSRTKFNNDKDKAGTGRRVLGTVLGAEAHVYTLEASFYGYSNSPTGPLKPFTQTDYLELGADLGRAMSLCFTSESDGDSQRKFKAAR